MLYALTSENKGRGALNSGPPWWLKPADQYSAPAGDARPTEPLVAHRPYRQPRLVTAGSLLVASSNREALSGQPGFADVGVKAR
ncbi:hypothetical protein ACFWY6_45380 [Streptomyces sp. NPDC059037]|uniref:hypothetical protein n=1 Tax=Streptomyces sp. NPDC059037 TaxID=3346710 RepID=UPI0036B1202B